VVTHQLQVERRTAKACRPKTDVLPLDHATNEMMKERMDGCADVNELDEWMTTVCPSFVINFLSWLQ